MYILWNWITNPIIRFYNEKRLIFALKTSNLNLVKELLKQDKSLLEIGYKLKNYPQSKYWVYGNRLLLFTFLNNDIEMAKLIIENDSNYYLKNKYFQDNWLESRHNSLIAVAYKKCTFDMIKLLISGIDNINFYISDNKINNLLTIAIKKADVDMVKLLLEKNANIIKNNNLFYKYGSAFNHCITAINSDSDSNFKEKLEIAKLMTIYATNQSNKSYEEKSAFFKKADKNKIKQIIKKSFQWKIIEDYKCTYYLNKAINEKKEEQKNHFLYLFEQFRNVNKAKEFWFDPFLKELNVKLHPKKIVKRTIKNLEKLNSEDLEKIFEKWTINNGNKINEQSFLPNY